MREVAVYLCVAIINASTQSSLNTDSGDHYAKLWLINPAFGHLRIDFLSIVTSAPSTGSRGEIHMLKTTTQAFIYSQQHVNTLMTP